VNPRFPGQAGRRGNPGITGRSADSASRSHSASCRRACPSPCSPPAATASAGPPSTNSPSSRQRPWPGSGASTSPAPPARRCSRGTWPTPARPWRTAGRSPCDGPGYVDGV